MFKVQFKVKLLRSFHPQMEICTFMKQKNTKFPYFPTKKNTLGGKYASAVLANTIGKSVFRETKNWALIRSNCVS
jgi:hypothetical protein